MEDNQRITPTTVRPLRILVAIAQVQTYVALEQLEQAPERVHIGDRYLGWSCAHMRVLGWP